jgi:hypothetical protein
MTHRNADHRKKINVLRDARNEAHRAYSKACQIGPAAIDAAWDTFVKARAEYLDALAMEAKEGRK